MNKEAIDFVKYNLRFLEDSSIMQNCDIKSEILEPLLCILNNEKENGNAYLEEFEDYISLKLKVDRLNNIINELEKYIIDKERECNGKIINYSISVEERIKYGNYNDIYDNVLDKLKELKGDDKE